MKPVHITQLHSIDAYLEQLSQLIIQVVDSNASIGFLPPLSVTDATEYWKTVLAPEVALLVAIVNNQLVGTIQLQLVTKQNGTHRAEIAKLMTHPKHRRKGIGQALMIEAEKLAKQKGRSLLVLDTREGDPSNNLYRTLGYIQAGRIPNFAKSSQGRLDATILYYKELL